jgi:hypothetical protein
MTCINGHADAPDISSEKSNENKKELEVFITQEDRN